MPYATQQNLIDRFGEQELIELTDRADPPAGAIDAAVMARALLDADGEINGYLAGKFTLPLTEVPLVLERVACDIARYYLFADRVTEIVQQRYKDAVRFLQGIANGSVRLGPGASDVEPAASGGPEYDAPDRIFTGTTLRDF